MDRVELEVVGVPWRIACADDESARLLRGNFRELLRRDAAVRDPIESLAIDRGRDTRWCLTHARAPPIPIADSYELLYGVEKTITIATQRHRTDLFFVHAAAVERDGAALLLIAASGGGKSTTTWALINRGFGYLSDELAPISLADMAVHPYPHALCLKQPPPPPFELPRATLATAHTLHVDPARVASIGRVPVPLRAVLFNRFDPASAPALSRIGSGEASAGIYRNGLNPLAHEGAGLAAAAQIAMAVPCFDLVTNDLERTCELVGDLLTGGCSRT